MEQQHVNGGNYDRIIIDVNLHKCFAYEISRPKIFRSRKKRNYDQFHPQYWQVKKRIFTLGS